MGNRELLYSLKSGLNLSSVDLLNLLHSNLYSKDITSKEQMIIELNCIEKCLNYDSEGNLLKLYNNIKSRINIYKKFDLFYKLLLEDITLRNLQIDLGLYKVIHNIHINNLNLENVSITIDIDEMQKKLKTIEKINKLENVSMPNIAFSDWNKFFSTRIFSEKSPFTFKKNLYLELGRTCNSKCMFCRNKYMNESEYNLENIQYNLRQIISIMDSVIIGGGEPILKREDLIQLLTEFKKYIDKFYIFSNGSVDVTEYLYIGDEVNYNISRHSYDDDINASIFGIPKSNILTYDDLQLLNNLTLACTCISGGIDTIEKIVEYIKIAKFYRINKIIFSNLQNDASVSISDIEYNDLVINDKLFDEAIEFLKLQGFKTTYPIISSGGYEMHMLKWCDMNIVFKKYITKKELEEKWIKATKRTFDLSLAPDGSLYSNWSETGEKVKMIK